MTDDAPREQLAELEAPLALRVRLAHGRIEGVEVDARRPLRAVRVLEGRPVEQALAALPELYRLCGTAQSVAGLRAVEVACGGGPGSAGRAARQLLVDAEALEQTLWRILLDWPRCVGAPPGAASLKRLRSRLGSLRHSVFGDGPWRRPGGAAVNADSAALLGTVEAVAAEVSEVVFGGVDAADALRDRRSFRRWIADAHTPTAAVLRWVAHRDRDDFGATGCWPTGELAAEAVAERLARDDDGSYCARPELAGEVPQTGALARHCDAALLRELRSAHGSGLATQLAARLVEVTALVAALRAGRERLAPEAAGPPPSAANGRGLGSADTARGRLFHWCEVRRGEIARYRILAPTEWNFHPRGPLVRGLVGSRAGNAADVEGAIALLVSAIDPCVGTELAVTEA